MRQLGPRLHAPIAVSHRADPRGGGSTAVQGIAADTPHRAATAATLQRQVRAAAGANGKGKGKMMWEALREAIDEEMERDPTVCVMGARSIALRQGPRRTPSWVFLGPPRSDVATPWDGRTRSSSRRETTR